MTSQNPTEPPVEDHDLIEWYAQLTQDEPDVLVSASSVDPMPKALRTTMKTAELTAAAEVDLEHDWQRLRFALRQESTTSPKTKTYWQLAALAATILVVAGITVMLPRTSTKDPYAIDQEAMRMRGTTSEVINSTDPVGDAKRLEQELNRAGVKVTRQVTSEKIELSIELIPPVSTTTKAILESWHIPLPVKSPLIVVFFK